MHMPGEICGLGFSTEFFLQFSVSKLDHRWSAVRTTERKVAFEQIPNETFNFGSMQIVICSDRMMADGFCDKVLAHA